MLSSRTVYSHTRSPGIPHECVARASWRREYTWTWGGILTDTSRGYHVVSCRMGQRNLLLDCWQQENILNKSPVSLASVWKFCMTIHPANFSFWVQTMSTSILHFIDLNARHSFILQIVRARLPARVLAYMRFKSGINFLISSVWILTNARSSIWLFVEWRTLWWRTWPQGLRAC